MAPKKKSTPKKSMGKGGTKVTVIVEMAKKKSAAEMRKDKAEDKREMMIQKQTLAALKKITKGKK